MKNKILATPAAKRIAKERELDIFMIPGTGRYGSVKAIDVLSYKEKRIKATPVAKEMMNYYNIDIEDLINNKTINIKNNKISKEQVLNLVESKNNSELLEDNKVEVIENTEVDEDAEVIELSGMRKIISENMINSMSTQPQYTMCAELDTTKVFKFLKDAKETYMSLTGYKLTLTDIIVKITALALMEHPIINASLMNNKILRYNTVNIGVAVALDNGLIVPVIKNAEKLSLIQINKIGQSLYKKAREGKLAPNEYKGSTFSISNLGNYPVDFSTPIINTPEGGILGISKTQQKPVVVEGEIVIRTMTGFSLTLDHRIIDGIEGAKFLKTFNELLQNPMCVLVEK